MHKWTDPDRIVLVVAGGEAGRFSAVFGPCDGMKTEPVTKEIVWRTPDGARKADVVVANGRITAIEPCNSLLQGGVDAGGCVVLRAAAA